MLGKMDKDFKPEYRSRVKPGDLVCSIPTALEVADMLRAKNEPIETGLVLAIINDVSIPPLIEVHWDNGYISKVSEDDITVITEGERSESTCK